MTRVPLAGAVLTAIAALAIAACGKAAPDSSTSAVHRGAEREQHAQPDDPGPDRRGREGHVGHVPGRRDDRPDPGLRLPGEHGHHDAVRLPRAPGARRHDRSRASRR